MNVAASLDSEQQDQILSLAREEIEGLKASRRGSQGLVLSESKTHGVSEALWIKGTRSSTEACGTHQTQRSVLTTSRSGRLHTVSSAALLQTAGLIYTSDTLLKHLCVKRWTVFINTIRRDDFWGVSQRDRVVRSHLICRHRTSQTTVTEYYRSAIKK